MGRRQCRIDFINQFLEVALHLFPTCIPELFYARQNLDGNHLTTVQLIFLDQTVAEFVAFVERLLDALWTYILAIGQNDEVLDPSYDVHITFFVETYEVARLNPTVGG